eukprot:TRINITY_DN32529_c0_g1_i1.p2 TRINITY_DN32529_c0_g1~~TRINITY_DN32529_c0_g1_i1.p2  ORF type:complete len:677 (+),score=228.77 TRINITY_DN32529_c0_g1_i1:74-2032(+)
MTSPTAKRPRVDRVTADFPIPEFPSKYEQVKVDPWKEERLSAGAKDALTRNLKLCRETIVAFTATGAASGYGGHTGGAFDTVPEVMILDAMFNACPDKFVRTFYDEAGHRVATQYMVAALRGAVKPTELLNYRRGHCGFPGHPELGHTPGVEFSSGRLGHMWPFVNGVAFAHPEKNVICLGSDGSQMEGNNAEAARLAVAKGLNVKLVIDDNNVTITGHPSDYLRGFDVAETLKGHGLGVAVVDGENIDAIYGAIRTSLMTPGPFAVVIRRKMAPGILGVEGTHQGHDVVPIDKGSKWLESKGRGAAAALLKTIKPSKDPHTYAGSGNPGSMRGAVGETLINIISAMSPAERKERVLYVDSDLGSSTGIAKLEGKCPEVYCHSGVMERGNFSAAAGFGSRPGRVGIMSTFAAFQEMLISEITMARMNHSNVICHFSHSGVDDMADNTCHFGMNNMFADNGLEDGYETRLYFPCDVNQASKLVQRIFNDTGMRFVYTTRSKTREVLKEDGKTPFFGPDYTFVPGQDDVIRTGSSGVIITYGDAVYRCLDAVEQLKKEGINITLVNKSTLNVVDEETMKKVSGAPFALVVEPMNVRTSVGMRLGTDLLTRGLAPPKKFAVIGTHHDGQGGLWEHAYHQGYDSGSVQAKVKDLLK